MTADSWRETTLGALLDFTTGKLDSNQADPDGAYPFFTCSPVTLRINDFAFDCEAVIIAGNNANGVFGVKYYKGKFNAYQRTYVAVPKEPRANDTRFAYYLVQDLTERLKQNSVGSVTRFLTLRILNDLRVRIPPLGQQRAVAELLGALDDKIDLNRRMNETLEAIARALFKSWFVDFDPVRAKAEGRQPAAMAPETAALFPDRFLEGSDDAIPQGWYLASLGDMASITSGKRPERLAKNKSNATSIPLFGGAGPMGYVGSALYEDPVIVTGRVGTLGKVMRVTMPCWPSDNALAVVPREPELYEYLYFQMQRIPYSSLNRGSTQPLLTQGDLVGQPVPSPSKKVLAEFHRIARALFAKMDANDAASSTCIALRDILLPKLLSGEVRIPGADRYMEATS